MKDPSKQHLYCARLLFLWCPGFTGSWDAQDPGIFPCLHCGILVSFLSCMQHHDLYPRSILFWNLRNAVEMQVTQSQSPRCPPLDSACSLTTAPLKSVLHGFSKIWFSLRYSSHAMKFSFLATQEAEAEESDVRSYPGEVSKNLSQKKLLKS